MPTTYAIPNGRTAFDATLFTSTGSAQTITNQYGFKPDFVWQKARSEADANGLIDSVRGVNKIIYSNLTNAEATATNALTAFNSNGYTGGGDAIATNGNTVVAWQWQAGQGTTSSNTNGSITSTVSVNATAGFSIVTYTGTGSVGTVGHGLGVAPSMIFFKDRTSGAQSWMVYHTSTGNQAYLLLNLTNAVATGSGVWNNTSPTSSVFSLGSPNNNCNASGDNYVAYCWAEIAGFSKFGSYTGNGSTDGSFVYLGFQPKFILIKRTDTTGDWYLWDTTRNPYNLVNLGLFPNQSSAEATLTNAVLDANSNGFKLRGTDAGTNASGGTYVYACFASNPFKYANAR